MSGQDREFSPFSRDDPRAREITEEDARLLSGEPEPRESWQPAPGYEGFYQISDQGRVWSERTSKILKPGRTGKAKHRAVQLTNADGVLRLEKVHRLVLLAFTDGPPPGKPCALHGPGGVEDNRLVNLYWGTHKQNTADMLRDGTAPIGIKHGCAKLTEDNVREIRKMRGSGTPLAEIAEHYGISEASVSNIARRKSWKHVT